MKYIFALMFGAALALLLSGYTPHTTHRGDPLTIHCQVSPDTWKRYTVVVQDTSYELRKYGAWSFTSETGLEVLSSICHLEIKH